MNAPHSLAQALALKSKNWRKGLAKIEAVGTNEEFGREYMHMHDDLLPGLGNYIIVS